MAFYNNYPQYYQQPQYTPQMQSGVAQQQSSNLIWVQGEASAKAYPVVAGQSVPLMDSEKPVFYIKSVDQSGMPLPLRTFDYKERTQPHTETPQTVAEPKVDYISRDEFDAFRDEIRGEIRQASKSVISKTTTTKEK